MEIERFGVQRKLWTKQQQMPFYNYYSRGLGEERMINQRSQITIESVLSTRVYMVFVLFRHSDYVSSSDRIYSEMKGFLQLRCSRRLESIYTWEYNHVP